jgi:ligand-binding SRPBCC domain-containing protein
MTRIELETLMDAQVNICFDLARSVELHQISTASTKEKAISGRTKGLCEKDDTITWRAKHFGLYHELTMTITEMNSPIFFEDVMVKGIFKSIRHRHHFCQHERFVVMRDVFEYQVPYGIFGLIFNKLILYRYMTRLLLKRNQTIKEFAEQENWMTILPKGNYDQH